MSHTCRTLRMAATYKYEHKHNFKALAAYYIRYMMQLHRVTLYLSDEHALQRPSRLARLRNASCFWVHPYKDNQKSENS